MTFNIEFNTYNSIYDNGFRFGGILLRRKYNTGTPDNLVDAAEKLFSQKGYAAVTLSAIASEANANVGQIVYHFGNKEALFQACILRRSEVLSLERRQLLKNYIQLVGSQNLKIEPLIRAFIDPFFDKVLSGDEAWHNYAVLLARVVWRDSGAEVIAKGFDDVAILFIENFQLALPTLTQDGAVRGFQFLLATLYSSLSDDRRIEHLTKGASSATDYAKYYKFLIPFVSAGFERIAEECKPNPKPSGGGKSGQCP